MRTIRPEPPRNVTSKRFDCRAIGALAAAIVAGLLLSMGGCQVFSFLPFVDAPADTGEEGEPQPLVSFEAEAELQRRLAGGRGSRARTQVPAYQADDTGRPDLRGGWLWIGRGP